MSEVGVLRKANDALAIAYGDDRDVKALLEAKGIDLDEFRSFAAAMSRSIIETMREATLEALQANDDEKAEEIAGQVMNTLYSAVAHALAMGITLTEMQLMPDPDNLV